MKFKLKANLIAVLVCAIAVVMSAVPAKASQYPVEGGDGTPITWNVKYVDGRNGSVFSDYSKLVEDGEKTPIYTPDEGVYPGYEFDGWEPELQQRVDCDMTYTAKWKVSENADSQADANDQSTGYDNAGADDIDTDTASQEENEAAAKKNASDNTYTDDGSDDATDQGLVDDTGSGKENDYADDVDSGDMNMPVIGGLLVLCIVLVGTMVFLLKRNKSR